MTLEVVSSNANILVFRFLLIRITSDDNVTSLELSWNLKVLTMEHSLTNFAIVVLRVFLYIIFTSHLGNYGDKR